MYALMISLAEKKGNHERILKMALLHDLPESRCTDVDYIQRLYVTRNEQMAIDDIFEGTVLKDEAKKILKEYHQRKTIESKIVKDADLIDADIELREVITTGGTMHQKHIADRTKGVIPRMFTKTAKEMFAKIHKADPNDWHRKALNNRFNGGDWKVRLKIKNNSMLYTGTVIIESLHDESVLNFVNVTSRETADLVDALGDQPKQVTVVTFTVADEMAPAVVDELSRLLKTGHWYADVRNEFDVFVVFPNKVFHFMPKETDKKQKVLEYAKTLSIPEGQIDF